MRRLILLPLGHRANHRDYGGASLPLECVSIGTPTRWYQTAPVAERRVHLYGTIACCCGSPTRRVNDRTWVLGTRPPDGISGGTRAEPAWLRARVYLPNSLPRDAVFLGVRPPFPTVGSDGYLFTTSSSGDYQSGRHEWRAGHRGM